MFRPGVVPFVSVLVALAFGGVGGISTAADPPTKDFFPSTASGVASWKWTVEGGILPDNDYQDFGLLQMAECTANGCDIFSFHGALGVMTCDVGVFFVGGPLFELPTLDQCAASVSVLTFPEALCTGDAGGGVSSGSYSIGGEGFFLGFAACV